MDAEKIGKRTRSPRDVADTEDASKSQIVAAVLAVLGGDLRYVLLDEIAIACHRVVPQAFSWPEYVWLPNVDLVRVTLVDVKRMGLVEEEKTTRGKTLGGYRLSRDGQGWAERNRAFLEQLRGRLPDRGAYTDVEPGDLVAVAILSAMRADGVEDVPRDRVVAEAYRLFPDIFEMPKYRGWPDAAAVDRALQHPTVVLAGNVCRLAPQQRSRVEALYKQIHVQTQLGFAATERRGTKGVALRTTERIARTRLVRDWRSGPNDALIRSEDVCDLLAVTLEADPATVRKHYESTLRLVEQAERHDLAAFMRWVGSWCESRQFRLWVE